MNDREALQSVCDDYVFYGRMLRDSSHAALRTELAKKGSRFGKIHRELAKADMFRGSPTLSRNQHRDKVELLHRLETADTIAAINQAYGVWRMGDVAQLFAMRCTKRPEKELEKLVGSPTSAATFVRALLGAFAPARVAELEHVERLVTACASGNVAAVTAACKGLSSVDFVLDCYNPRFPWQAPLTIAVDRERPAVIDYLAANGADLNVQYSAPNMATATPLTTAALRGKVELVKQLVRHGADPMRGESDGNALHIAVAYGHLPVATYLIEECNVKLDARNRYRRTALMECGNNLADLMSKRPVPETKRIELARYLIGRGADPTLKNLDGYTPLKFAEDNRFTKLASYLGSL